MIGINNIKIIIKIYEKCFSLPQTYSILYIGFDGFALSGQSKLILSFEFYNISILFIFLRQGRRRRSTMKTTFSTWMFKYFPQLFHGFIIYSIPKCGTFFWNVRNIPYPINSKPKKRLQIENVCSELLASVVYDFVFHSPNRIIIFWMQAYIDGVVHNAHNTKCCSEIYTQSEHSMFLLHIALLSLTSLPFPAFSHCGWENSLKFWNE